MKDLIAALNIFAKYTDSEHPTNTAHDELIVCVDPADVSDEDKAELCRLGFIPDAYDARFISFRFGGC